MFIICLKNTHNGNGFGNQHDFPPEVTKKEIEEYLSQFSSQQLFNLITQHNINTLRAKAYMMAFIVLFTRNNDEARKLQDKLIVWCIRQLSNPEMELVHLRIPHQSEWADLGNQWLRILLEFFKIPSISFVQKMHINLFLAKWHKLDDKKLCSNEITHWIMDPWNINESFFLLALEAFAPLLSNEQINTLCSRVFMSLKDGMGIGELTRTCGAIAILLPFASEWATEKNFSNLYVQEHNSNIWRDSSWQNLKTFRKKAIIAFLLLFPKEITQEKLCKFLENITYKSPTARTNTERFVTITVLLPLFPEYASVRILDELLTAFDYFINNYHKDSDMIIECCYAIEATLSLLPNYATQQTLNYWFGEIEQRKSAIVIIGSLISLYPHLANKVDLPQFEKLLNKLSAKEVNSYDLWNAKAFSILTPLFPSYASLGGMERLIRLAHLGAVSYDVTPIYEAIVVMFKTTSNYHVRKELQRWFIPGDYLSCQLTGAIVSALPDQMPDSLLNILERKWQSDSDDKLRIAAFQAYLQIIPAVDKKSLDTMVEKIGKDHPLKQTFADEIVSYFGQVHAASFNLTQEPPGSVLGKRNASQI